MSAETIAQEADRPAPRGRRIARNTAIFSIATGLSRIAGLGREIIASSYFGTSGSFSAFTLAFQIPNLVRGLVADAALSAAFVPVFSELLEQGRRREAFRLASTLFLLMLAATGALVAMFLLGAGVILPLFTGKKFTPELVSLTVGLSRVLFPILILLALNGLVVGILQAYDHFAVPALAPVVWNGVIIAFLVGLRGLFHGDNQLYAYAIGVLVATAVQFAIALPVLRRIDFRLTLAFDWRSPRVRQVFRLMLPVSIGLGVIYFDVLINSSLGSRVSVDAPRAIDAAFRLYQLPQGIFSVAVATVLFPTLSRLAARRDDDGLRGTLGVGMRQMLLFMIPAAAFTLALATPLVRLVFQRGAFDAHSTRLVSIALFWFSFSLPTAGINLLLSRTFFALQRPWIPTTVAGVNLVVDLALSFALYRPLGIAGLVIATATAGLVMTIGQTWALRRRLGHLEGPRTLLALAQIAVASAGLGGTAYGTWWGADQLVGRSLGGQIVSVGLALVAGICVYAGTVLLMRLPEAQRIARLVTARLGRA